MFGRGCYSAGNIFGSVLVALFIAAVLAVVFVYISWIALVVIVAIGLAIGLGYSLYVYIKSLIRAASGIASVTGSNFLATILLRWITLFGKAAKYAFADNFFVARNAVAKAGGYRFFSPRKWLWLTVAVSTMLIGTLLILVIVLLQAGVAIVLGLVAAMLVLAVCVVLFVLSVFYSIVATVRNAGGVFASSPAALGGFDFSVAARFSALGTGPHGYFAALGYRLAGFVRENFRLGASNIHMASGYRWFSPVRYFLYVSVGSLLVVAVITDILFAVLFIVFFPFLLLAQLVWACIAAVIRLF